MHGLYVHVPFCVSKCSYCDFYSLPGRIEAAGDYVKAIIEEAKTYRGMSFDTLYIGGGTPSVLGAQHLETLMSGLNRQFDFSAMVEATIEVNPDSATDTFLQPAKKFGLNRVSVGVQSLSDNELKSVNRVHTAAQAVKVIELIKAIGFKSVSADLIIGLPGQSWVSLAKSLKTLTNQGVQHLSVYCMSLEYGTPLAQFPPANLPNEDLQAELYEKTRDYLTEQGFTHYEISNFALPGFECLHNINYWHGGDYLGLGPAAASHLDGKRFKNRNDLDAYLANPIKQTEVDEVLDEMGRLGEEAMLRLRLLVEGINPSVFSGRYNPEAIVRLIDRLNKLTERGLLETDGIRYRLAKKYVLTSNGIFQAVLESG